MFPLGASLDIQLKAPKSTSGKSKKIYRNVFIRTLDKGKTHHLYASDRLYICSHYMKSLEDVMLWIDKNINEIRIRVDRVQDMYPDSNSVEEKQQGNLFS